VSALSDPNSLIPLVSILSYNLHWVYALIDSSSTHCFIDAKFTDHHSLPMYNISPITL